MLTRNERDNAGNVFSMMGSNTDIASLERLRVRVTGLDNKDPESLMENNVLLSSAEKRRNFSRQNLAVNASSSYTPPEMRCLQLGRSNSPGARRLWLLLAMVFTFFVLYVGYETSVTLDFVIGLCIVMLLFSFYLAKWVLEKDEGTKDMQDVRVAASQRTRMSDVTGVHCHSGRR